MQTITFQCETITPMFLAGADGTTPELRAPSIKGALRFWWRAMNGHLQLEDTKDNNGKVIIKGMRTIEGEIFGDTSQRSKVIIICEQKEFEVVNQYKMIAHKSGATKSFKLDEQLNITFKLIKNIDLGNGQLFNFEKLKALFEIVCYLGGIGKRSRRGNGCLKIKTYIEKDKIEQTYSQLIFNKTLIDKLNLVSLDKNQSTIFKISTANTNLIESSFSNLTRLTPHILSIEKVNKNGNNEQKRLLISKATHNTILNEANNKNIPTETKNEYTTVHMRDRRGLDYSNYVGAGQPRFASPIIASISPNDEVIVTKLKTIKVINEVPSIINNNRLTIQTNLINEIKTII